MAASLDLTNISQDFGFIWTKKQVGDAFRVARLDNFYMSEALLERWPSTTSSLDRSTQIFDHYPLILKATSTKDKTRNGWLHANVAFFGYLEVGQNVMRIFKDCFEHVYSSSKAWV